jgi:hypothetical protein
VLYTSCKISCRSSLSSPFMDASSACSFFEIILGLFIEARTGSPAKLVGRSSAYVISAIPDPRLPVLDEAHKVISLDIRTGPL